MMLQPVDTQDPLTAGAARRLAEGHCIVGSAGDADLPLPPTPDVGRIHAVIRLRDGHCSVETISALGDVLVNGRPLAQLQHAVLLPGDTLQINHHVWTLKESASAPAGESGAETPPATDAGTLDIFDGLLGGPGVVPVGAPLPPQPDSAQTHIMSDTRPTVLHHREPEMLRRRDDDIGDVLDGRQPPLNLGAGGDFHPINPQP